jgi:hypothetical protein
VCGDIPSLLPVAGAESRLPADERFTEIHCVPQFLENPDQANSNRREKLIDVAGDEQGDLQRKQV